MVALSDPSMHSAHAWLTGLATRLNGVTTFDSATVIGALLPQLLAGPAAPLRVTAEPSHRRLLDCSDLRYAEVLSGQSRPDPAAIVDFVPVGYDLDLLELRLLENYEHVACFVLYEAVYTQRGEPKPLYFNLTRARFARFADKIIHFVGTEQDLRAVRARTLSARAGKIKPARSGNSPLWAKDARPSWALEESMRRVPIEKFRASSHPLATALRQRAEAVLVLQNDGDEVASSATLRHLRHCQTRVPPPYYVPCTSYKLSYRTLQRTYDRKELGARWAHAVPSRPAARTAGAHPANASAHMLAMHELASFAWAPGPTVLSLAAGLSRFKKSNWAGGHSHRAAYSAMQAAGAKGITPNLLPRPM